MDIDFIEWMAKNEQSIFCNAYTGLGDAIVLGPILAEINRRYPGRIYYPANPLLDLYQKFNVTDLNNIHPVNSSHRRLSTEKESLSQFLSFLQEKNIGTVLNFRRDLQYGESYLNAATHLRSCGYYISDLCADVPESIQETAHFFDLACAYIQRLGMTIEKPKSGWLLESMTSPPKPKRKMLEPSVLIYMGASQSHKRLSPALWIETTAKLYANGFKTITLLTGRDDTEQTEALEVIEALNNMKIAHHFAPAMQIEEIIGVLMPHQLTISCDTYMVHLCGALGIPVIALYFSTDSKIYGPHLQTTGGTIAGTFYYDCPKRNKIGNCDAWERGCVDTPCKADIKAELIVREAKMLIEKSLEAPKAELM